MIDLISAGEYSLLETKDNTKILKLARFHHDFAWVMAKNIGELLVTTHKEHPIDSVLCCGEYKLYKVSSEPNLVDNWHLELDVGRGKKQGYLLLTGLPDDNKVRGRIIPTKELIKL